MRSSDAQVVELLINLDPDQWDERWQEIEELVVAAVAGGGGEVLLSLDEIHGNRLASRVLFASLKAAYLAGVLPMSDDLQRAILRRLAALEDDPAMANGWGFLETLAHDGNFDLTGHREVLVPALVASLRSGRKYREGSLDLLSTWWHRSPILVGELVRSEHSLRASLTEVIELGEPWERELLAWLKAD